VDARTGISTKYNLQVFHSQDHVLGGMQALVADFGTQLRTRTVRFCDNFLPQAANSLMPLAADTPTNPAGANTYRNLASEGYLHPANPIR
jgi:hypothetical protein